MSTDQVLLHRFVIEQLAAAGVDPRRLAREAGLPEWALTGDSGHLPSPTFSRLWEVAAHALGDPDVALRVGGNFQLSSLGLYDYLFSTAPTLGAGLATSDPYVTAVTTNHRFHLLADNEREVTLYLDMLDGEGPGRDLTQLWGLIASLTRARRAVRGPIVPLKVGLRQQAPSRQGVYREAFGTGAVEFGAAYDGITFRAADMDLPLVTADSALAAVLRPLADALPPPPPLRAVWPRRVAAALERAMDEGDVSLERVARALALSPRTLQRRLAEAGTTWRRELDRARDARLRRAVAVGPMNRSRQAELLGYSDAASMRRAARRWSAARRGPTTLTP
ncbi:AraC family transcriptional regulator [Nocardia asteroides]|uniref:AraC family transcriptional regulator n=1 Tax=Nocardia asteroides TaxID=1824 RepID=UPI001E3231A1|nr:AraC family transcriptional regulator [Nocardia asteroides]UGT63879.1 AraC family transcriptional regulator [Nocardia asteroides]